MKHFNGIVIHHSESDFGTAQDIEDWHKKQGWDDIGYHACISNGWIDKDRYVDFMNGQIEIGRDWNAAGAHAVGYNDSFGLVLIGFEEFSDQQFDALLTICRALLQEYGFGVDDIIGHYECENGKPSCPGFDVSEVRRILAAEEDVWNG